MIKPVLNAYRSAFSGLCRETWLLSMVMLVNRAGTMAIPFMSLYVTVKLGRSLADAGLILTLFGIGSVFGALLGGFLTDRIGFRVVQITAAIVSGLLFILYSKITHFGSLCLLTVVLSIAADALRPANHAAIAHYSLPGNLTRCYTLNRLAINLGWSIGGAIGGILAAIDYHLLFWVDGCTNLLAGLMIWYFLPSVKELKKKFSFKVEKPEGSIGPWQDNLFIRFFLCSTLFTTAFFLVFRLVPVFWRTDWHIGEQGIGLLLGLNGLIIAFSEMILVKRWEGRGNFFRYIIYGTMACGIGYLFLMIPVHAGLILAVLFICAITFGEMLAFPFISSFMMSRANSYNRGAYATAITLSWSFAQIVGPSGGGWIAEKYGFFWLWVVLIFLCILAGLGFYDTGKRQKKAIQENS